MTDTLTPDTTDTSPLPTPVPDPLDSPVEYGPLRCNNREQLGDGTMLLKLSTNRPLVFVQDALPGFSRDEIWKWLLEGHQRWGGVCDWLATRIMDLSEAKPSDVVQVVTVADLGGGGVLADMMLPYPNARRLTMRINARIRWKATDGPMQSGTVDPIRTLCHETGHFMGHQHWPQGAPLELMEPFVSQTIIRPQPTEGKVSAGWFGASVSPPSPVPAPPGDLDTARAEIARLRRVIEGIVRDGQQGLLPGTLA